MSKVKIINLKTGMPTVDQAISKLKNELLTARMSGFKAAVLIHGYGSGGTGGAIRHAVYKCLSGRDLVGIVKDWTPGTEWMDKSRTFLSHCPGLAVHRRHIDGNQGITVVLIK